MSALWPRTSARRKVVATDGPSTNPHRQPAPGRGLHARGIEAMTPEAREACCSRGCLADDLAAVDWMQTRHSAGHGQTVTVAGTGCHQLRIYADDGRRSCRARRTVRWRRPGWWRLQLPLKNRGFFLLDGRATSIIRPFIRSQDETHMGCSALSNRGGTFS
jgi:uncharacterized ParB-like nuclease family protein